MKFSIVLIAILMSFSSANADDLKAPALIRLGEISIMCKIELSKPVDDWFNAMYKLADQKVYDSTVLSAKNEYTLGVATEGPITYCWKIREQMRSAGFL